MEKGSLKLKLKLGTTPEPSAMEGDPAVLTDEEEEDVAGDQDVLLHAVKEEPGREKQHKKSKKKKKKKEREKDRHRHKRERSQQEVTSVESDELGVKKMRLSEDVASTATSSTQPNPVMVAAALQELLMHLLKLLEKKDTNQFFIDPVTDAIAPGYSSIITQPMCFATMRDKVARGLYISLKLFEDDVKLIVSNCLKYNGPDTVYYSAGKKLLVSAHSLLSRDKLLALRKDMPNMAILPYEIAGVNLAEGVAEGGDSGGDDRTDSPNSQDSRSECDDDDDDDSEEEAARVSAQAAKAARAAATALHRAKPTSTMGYLRTNHDGSVGLSFLSGCEGEHSPGSKQPLSMGLVLGKLTAGSSTLHNYHDDKRTMAKPVKPIHYGSYSSFCPSYDSTFANLSKEESDLVRATYGNDTAVQYAESICEFSRDCSMATTLVDQLLNLLTAGQHSRTRATIAAHHHMLQQRAEQQQQHDDKKVAKAATDGLCPSSTASNLRSLADLGIDVSFLDTIEHAEQQQQSSATAALSHTAALIESLANEQTERLSRQPAHSPLLLPSQPSHTEHRLAEQLTSELVMVARQLPPSALLPIPLPATTV